MASSRGVGRGRAERVEGGLFKGLSSSSHYLCACVCVCVFIHEVCMFVFGMV